MPEIWGADWRAGLAHCLEPSGALLTLPPACYAADDVFAQELEAIFDSGWLCLGRADRFTEPGDYEAIDIATRSFILLRDDKGDLQAFANCCRHRGARLLDGRGSIKLIRCPFHSWAYRLDGRLAAAPRMDALADFDKAENGLIALAVEEAFGFIFLHPGRDPTPLSGQLADFESLHAAWPLDALVTTRRRLFDVACNWKAFLDVFNEYYHLPAVHPRSIDGLFDEPDPSDQPRGAFASQFGVTIGTSSLLKQQQDAVLPKMPGLTGRAASGTRYTWLFPNVTFALSGDALWLYEVYPTGPTTCRVGQSVGFPRETIAHSDFEDLSARYYSRMDAAIEEDVPALENQQRGLSTPHAQQGQLHPLLEGSIGTFGTWYARRMLGHQGASSTSG